MYFPIDRGKKAPWMLLVSVIYRIMRLVRSSQSDNLFALAMFNNWWYLIFLSPSDSFVRSFHYSCLRADNCLTYLIGAFDIPMIVLLLPIDMKFSNKNKGLQESTIRVRLEIYDIFVLRSATISTWDIASANKGICAEEMEGKMSSSP